MSMSRWKRAFDSKIRRLCSGKCWLSNGTTFIAVRSLLVVAKNTSGGSYLYEVVLHLQLRAILIEYPFLRLTVSVLDT